MTKGEDEFVKRRIYLTLERGRDIALRNLLRKVYLAGGFEDALDGLPPRRRTRIPVAEFGAAICLGSQVQVGRLENDEVECLLANMIYKVGFLVASVRARKIVDFSAGVYLMAKKIAEPHERVHLTRTRHCRFEQRFCIPRNWRVNI